MKLRNIEFGTAIGASGIEGFFGEGYWYHYLWKLLFPLWFSFRGMTFCAKTVLWPYRPGNTPMYYGKKIITPIEPKPASIFVSFLKKAVVNAIGLATEGVEKSFARNRWQERTEPFFISFALHSEDEEEQVQEAIAFAKVVTRYKPKFKAPFGIQWNDSCGNTRKPGQISKAEFLRKILDILGAIDVPVVIKINTSMPIQIALEVESHPALDGWCCSNAIFWDLISKEDRIKYFGSETSPLEKRWDRKLFYFFGRKLFTIPNAKGAVSGKPLLQMVLDWITKARKAGLQKPIIGGGGIYKAAHVDRYFEAGANAISPGSMVIHTPWNLRAVIGRAAVVFS